MIGIKLSETLAMSLHFGVGTGTGVRAVTDLRLARPTGRGCTCVSCFFYQTRAGCKGYPKHPARSFTQEARAQGQLTGVRLARPVIGVAPALVFVKGRES